MHTSSDQPPSSAADRRFRVAAFASAGIGVFASLALVPQVLKRLGQPMSSDFGVFYAAGRLAAGGHWLSVYSTARLNHVEAAVSGGKMLHLFFPYPPYVTLLLNPLSRLGVTPAYAIWTGLNLLAYVFAIALAWSAISRTWRPLALAIATSCLPLIISTAQGENGGLVALGMMATLTALYGREKATGWESALLPVGLALLLLKPQFLVLPMILLAMRHRPRELALAAGTGVIALCAGLAAGGVLGYTRFIQVLVGGLQTGSKFHWGPGFNYTLQSQTQALLGRSVASTGMWLVLCLVLAGCLFLWKTGEEPPWLALGAVAVLITTHAMFHDLPLLYPLAILSAADPKQRWGVVAVLASVCADPAIYPSTHVHVVVIALLVPVLLAAQPQIGRVVRTMRGNRLGVPRSKSWKLFGQARWGSASGSETP